jgi:hypothetical protein
MEILKDDKVGRKATDLIVAAGKRHSVKRPGKKAKKEEQNFSEQDKDWPFKIRRAVFQVLRGGVWAISLFFTIALLVVMFHYVAPTGWKWLGPPELHTLTDVVGYVGSGALGAFCSKYFKNLFAEIEPRPP